MITQYFFAKITTVHCLCIQHLQHRPRMLYLSEIKEAIYVVLNICTIIFFLSYNLLVLMGGPTFLIKNNGTVHIYERGIHYTTGSTLKKQIKKSVVIQALSRFHRIFFKQITNQFTILVLWHPIVENSYNSVYGTSIMASDS
jgi:hypothetical protein